MKVNFKPVIGSSYAERGNVLGGVRLCVVGMSHYCQFRWKCNSCGTGTCPFNENVEGNFTKEKTIRPYLNYLLHKGPHDCYMNGFTSFARSIMGRNGFEYDFWQSIAFFNFTQIAMLNSEHQPDKEELELSRTIFFELLSLINPFPEYVIMWGKAFDEAPEENWIWIDKKKKIGEYIIPNKGHVKVLGIHHPSCGFKKDHWGPIIRKFIDHINESENGI